MSRSDTDPEDLSAYARRCLLTEAEERELEAALRRDPVLRTAHQVGVDFDHSTAMRPGDDELVARAATAALSRVAEGGAPVAPARPSGFRLAKSRDRKRFVSVLLAAAIVSVTGLAAAIWSGAVPASWLGVTRREPGGGTGTATSRKSMTPATMPAVHTPAPEPTEVATDDGTNAEAVQPQAEETRAAQRASRPPAEDAATLFRTANAARHDGEFGRAKHLYSELIARYPSSDEARLARVSLGKLLLAKGDPSDAEREFSQYLKGGKGPLAEEALVSRAQSLERLGRADEERSTWQRLLAEHPNSVYAAQARQRLEALRTSGAPSAP